MNIREIETLLLELRQKHTVSMSIDQCHRVDAAIKWCKSQQKAAASRKAVFKHKYDQQREMLR